MYFNSRLLKIHEETINIACNLSLTSIAQFTQPADPHSLLSQRGQEEHRDGRRIIAQYTTRTPKSLRRGRATQNRKSSGIKLKFTNLNVLKLSYIWQLAPGCPFPSSSYCLPHPHCCTTNTKSIFHKDLNVHKICFKYCTMNFEVWL